MTKLVRVDERKPCSAAAKNRSVASTEATATGTARSLAAAATPPAVMRSVAIGTEQREKGQAGGFSSTIWRGRP
jgi:hypothetical protein